ncbi:MAG: sel1 repeat family protein, partial [Alphaproteobacteria bacterium]
MTQSRRHGGVTMSLTRTALLMATASLIALTALPSQAGFDAGWAAYQNGDFATALSEWKPLAANGDARAQFNIGVMYDQGKG